MKNVNLDEFVTFLEGLSPTDFKGTRIEKFLEGHRLDAASLNEFCCFKDDSYGRNLISKNKNYELLILTWMPGQRTPIHDHFGQRCWMLIQTGSLTMKNYRTPEHPLSPLVPLGSVDYCSTGQCVYIDDNIAVHSIANGGQEPSVSVHLYAGPVPKCHIYNDGLKRFESVTLAYTNDFSKQFAKANASFTLTPSPVI